jgi:transcriptional regulator with XRE-family HTH domain
MHMDMPALVGWNFARLRREKGLTQEQVATRSGFSRQYLSALERGRKNPRVTTLYKLALSLEVSHVELLRLPALNDETSAASEPAESK